MSESSHKKKPPITYDIIIEAHNEETSHKI